MHIKIKNGLTKEKSEKFCISSQIGGVPARMASMRRHKISYAGKEMGGDSILTLSHDIDLSLFLW